MTEVAEPQAKVARFACPKCNDEDHIDISVRIFVRLAQKPDGEFETMADETMADHEWNGHSIAVCTACRHVGKVDDFDREQP